MDIEEIEKTIKEGKTEDKMPSLKKDIYLEGKKVIPAQMRGSAKKELEIDTPELKGKIIPMKKGGKVKSASVRADGCAQRGKTKGKIV